MQVFGNLATALEERTSKNGKKYYTGRLAENQGKDENRTTTWYDLTVFFTSELDADLLSKGQFVKVTGRVEARAFLKKNGEPGASLSLVTSRIEPVESTVQPKSREESAEDVPF